MYIEGASLYASSHDKLMLWINILTIAAFIILNSVLIYFIIRYRKRSDNDITSPIAGSTILEIVWTVIPSLVLVWLYIWGSIVFIKMRTIPTGENVVDITVTAQQWAWSFAYPSSFRKNPEKPTVLKSNNILYLEEGRPFKLVMSSTDVIHSFFIPSFRIKEDVVPGMYTYTTFTPLISASQKGKGRAEYNIFCTEYCGKDHSGMLGKAIVLSPAKFQEQMEKIETEAGNISSGRGREIFEGNCKSCHSIDGSRLVGPSFKGLWKKDRKFTDGSSAQADENYIRNSVIEPAKQVVEGYPAAMPVQSYGDSEIQSIIEYIKSLSSLK